MLDQTILLFFNLDETLATLNTGIILTGEAGGGRGTVHSKLDSSYSTSKEQIQADCQRPFLMSGPDPDNIGFCLNRGS
jgi:hypothetical protein